MKEVCVKRGGETVRPFLSRPVIFLACSLIVDVGRYLAGARHLLSSSELSVITWLFLFDTWCRDQLLSAMLGSLEKLVVIYSVVERNCTLRL